MSNKKIFTFLILIFVTLFLRFFWLDKSNIIPDEPAYIVRSFGWVDTLWSQAQTTPTDWFKVLPWWTKLSFHDHPPLTFVINFIFLNVLGFSLWAGRLASVLFGVGSVIWVYLLGDKIFGKKIAFLAAALYSVNCLVVFFDRSAMMEAISGFFILGSAWFFLQAVENKKFLFGFAVFAGLAILSKYIFLFFVPVYVLLILIYKRDWLKTKLFYLSILLFLLIISPLLVYNFYLFQYSHHFDVQLATLFGQKTPEWIILAGKNKRGELIDRLKNISVLVGFCSPLFATLAFSSFIYTPFYYLKSRKLAFSVDLPRNLLYLSVLFYFLALLYIGPAARFVYYFIPWLCLLVADFFVNFTSVFRLPIWPIFSVVLLLELLVTLNTTFGTIYFGEPKGKMGITFPPSSYQLDRGVQKLNFFLDNELKNNYSALLLNFPSVPALDKIIKRHVQYQQNKNALPLGVSIVNDSHMGFAPLFWALVPRAIYQGWPVLDEKLFFDNYARGNLKDFITYYVLVTKENPHREEYVLGDYQNQLLTNLAKQKINPIIITSTLGIPMFEVYKIPPAVLPRLFDKVGVTATSVQNVLNDKNATKPKRSK